MMAAQETLQKQVAKPENILQDPKLVSLIGKGVPTCGGNLHSPVVDTVGFVGEISYQVGGRTYIERADGGGMPEV